LRHLPPLRVSTEDDGFVAPRAEARWAGHSGGFSSY
jgi:hypothetical protein